MFALSNEEWRNVAILCKFLKFFYDVTCVFSGSNYPTANLYFRGVWKVHKVLLDTVKDFVETILNNLRLLFDEYVKKSNPRLPLWLGVLMFRIKILLILVCINTMLIVLILGEVLIKVMIINGIDMNLALRVKSHSWTFIWKNRSLS
ncbi:hypothetical protein Goarm_022166 [Gossypium armourianum]|uniref:hAT-like transposase RNase-H fold domain-containing protein n=1 Tax=Gossypium armourianum TaxID=34283 RepID=A0A7J9KGN2_9ROSI|nr:hypothetical protein [Gossypium armourianum]